MRVEDLLCVVSVVGMGGLGKTTLAKLVYSSSDVKRHFDCCAWVFISQQFAVRDVLFEILVQIGFDDIAKKNLEELKKDKELLEKMQKRETIKTFQEHELIERAMRGIVFEAFFQRERAEAKFFLPRE
ncbi:NB-ARC domain containing protein [Parasponia andersonii]|uniref:NB-ARC domain containing protein n=1 Tax=Parasponia andersonii TaxID=3476 RepID=A0A2P5B7J1_PARAD|nr:NB-ARC domain containing protein [Parasponia andersonii]